MKQIIVAVVFFSLMACSKKDSNSIGSDALPKAIFQNGKKMTELFYDNAGRLIKINFYNEQGLDTLQGIEENMYNGKGLLIKKSYRYPDSSFIDNYDEYTYNAKNERITHKVYYLTQQELENGKKDKIYTEGSSWVMDKIDYDEKQRVKRIEGTTTQSMNTNSNAEAYTYDNNNNVLTCKRYYKSMGAVDFELQSTEMYEYDLNISNPRLFNVLSEFPFNQSKNFKIKTIEEHAYNPGKKDIITVVITKKDSKGNISEIKETDTKSSGETKETITSLQY